MNSKLTLAEGLSDRQVGACEVAAPSEEAKTKQLHDSAFQLMFSTGRDNFDRDVRMQQLFGNPMGNKFDPDWAYLKQQFDIFYSEVEEMRDDGIAARNFTELLDGIGDAQTVLYAICNAAGVDIRQVHDAVHKSNLTKFCRNEKDLNDTIAHYAAQGVNVASFGEFPFVCVRTVGENVVKGKPVPEGKFLKCIHYQEPDFSEVMKPYDEATRIAEALEGLHLSSDARKAILGHIRKARPIDNAQMVLNYLNS